MSLAVALPLLLLVPSEYLFGDHSQIPVANQLALTHTFFNVVAALVALPFLGNLLSFVERWLIAPRPEEDFKAAGGGILLDESALNIPSLALVQATREVQRMSDEVKETLLDFWRARQQRDSKAVREITLRNDAVDEFNHKLTIYLHRIGSVITDEETYWKSALLQVTRELKAAGDVLEHNLTGSAMKEIRSGLILGDEEEASLEMLYHKTARQLDRLLTLLATRDAAIAAEMIQIRNEISMWTTLEKQTVNQTLCPDPDRVSAVLTYLDLVEGFRQINKYLGKAVYGLHQQPENGAVEAIS